MTVGASTLNRTNDYHMVSNYAKNGVEIQYRLPAVRDCHIDENRTQALSHERGDVGAFKLNRSNDVRMVSIPAKNGVEI